jgi:hypothetical protein
MGMLQDFKIFIEWHIVSYSVADPGSGIRDWVLFDPWIRDPE